MKTTLCMNNRRSINQTTFLIHSSYSYSCSSYSYYFFEGFIDGFLFSSLHILHFFLCLHNLLNTSRNGDTKEQRVTTPDSANNLATSATRLIFSWRSSSENPRSEFKPNLMLSPSKLKAGIPLITK